MFCVDDTGRTLFVLHLLNYCESRLSGPRFSFRYLKLNIIKWCLRQFLMNGFCRWLAKQYCFISFRSAKLYLHCNNVTIKMV